MDMAGIFGRVGGLSLSPWFWAWRYISHCWYCFWGSSVTRKYFNFDLEGTPWCFLTYFIWLIEGFSCREAASQVFHEWERRHRGPSLAPPIEKGNVPRYRYYHEQGLYFGPMFLIREGHRLRVRQRATNRNRFRSLRPSLIKYLHPISFRSRQLSRRITNGNIYGAVNLALYQTT